MKIIKSEEWNKINKESQNMGPGIKNILQNVGAGAAQGGLDTATAYAQEVIDLINTGVQPQQAFDQIVKVKHQMDDKPVFKNKVIEIVKKIYNPQAVKTQSPSASNQVQAPSAPAPVSTFGNQPNKNWAVPIR